MSNAKQRSSFDTECGINEFRNKCSAFFASKDGREACTDRYSHIVQSEKIRGDVFAECARKAMAEVGGDVRVVVESDGVLFPVVYAKVVDTAKAFIPYIFRRQRWNPFKKHEPVLVLLASNYVPDLDSALTLSELEQSYVAGGFKPFDDSLPWLGVGIQERANGDGESQGSRFSLNLAYNIKTVGFDADESRIVVKAKDVSFELVFGLRVHKES